MGHHALHDSHATRPRDAGPTTTTFFPDHYHYYHYYSTTTTTTTCHLHTKRHVAAAVIGAAHLSIALLGRFCARQLHRHEPAAQLQLRHADKGVLCEEAEPCRADAPVQAEPHTREHWDLLVRGSSPLWHT